LIDFEELKNTQRLCCRFIFV